MSAVVQRAFLPANLAMGFGTTLAGAVVLLLFHFVIPVMPMLIVIGAQLAVPIGLLIALSAFGHRCVRCREPLKLIVFGVPAADRPQLKAALRATTPDALVTLLRRGSSTALNQLDVKCAYCPSCREVARLKVPGWGATVMSGAALRALIDARI